MIRWQRNCESELFLEDDQESTRSRFDRLRSVIEAIDRKKFEVIPIAITKEGKWLGPAEAGSPAAVDFASSPGGEKHQQ